MRLPEVAAEDEKRCASERLTGLRLRWTEASEEQRTRWLDELPGHIAGFAPVGGAELLRLAMNSSETDISYDKTQ